MENKISVLKSNKKLCNKQNAPINSDDHLSSQNNIQILNNDCLQHIFFYLAYDEKIRIELGNNCLFSILHKF